MADGAQAFAAWTNDAIRSLYDPERGRIDRRIYADESLYRLELERIFARGWNFMCHDSQVREAGDYVVSWIGEDQVIAVRDEQGAVNVLVNSCRHRGNALCRAEEGRAKSFVCSYHGWNYGLDGSLIGVPGQKTYYHGELDRSALGLHRAAKVESYLGFWFATMDADAPPLHDFLGDAGRAGLGMICAHGEVEVVDGVQKNLINCNWKVAVDNLFDWYHVMYSHASAGSSGFLNLAEILHPKNQLVMLSEYGHAISGPGIPAEMQAQIDALTDEQRAQFSAPGAPRLRPKAAKDLMGPVGVRSMGHPNLFPNFWVTIGGLQACLRIPRGPSTTELWWYTFVQKDVPPEMRRAQVRMATHLFGPAGLLEQDDGENWIQSTRAARGVVGATLGQTLQMGIGKDEARRGPAGEHFIDTTINEHGQRWFYRGWVDWMTAGDWGELRGHHTPLPQGMVR